MQEVRIVTWVKDTEKAEQEINNALSDGFEIYSTIPAGILIIYTLLKTTKIYGGSGSTTYPSDKQLGYICWAYRETGIAFDTLNISKTQASELIQRHKEDPCSDPFEKKDAMGHIEQVLKGAAKNVPSPDTSDEEDSDIPF